MRRDGDVVWHFVSALALALSWAVKESEAAGPLHFIAHEMVNDFM